MDEKLVLHQRGCEVLGHFGRNQFGEPLYRIVRADSRKQYIAGEYGPKYPAWKAAWVIEAWCAPENYGEKSQWEETRTLGPFPSRGDYEFVLAIADKYGNTFEPSDHQLQWIASALTQSKGVALRARFNQLKQAQEDAKEARMKVLRDMIADCAVKEGSVSAQKHEEILTAPTPVQRPTMPTGASLA